MTSPLNSFWIRIDVTLKNLTTFATEVVSFVNRPYYPSNDLTQYWPILNDISDIGNVAANNLPADIVASFTISNTIGSFGFQRKFSDKFERQTIINQDIKVYRANTTPDSKGPTSWTQIFGGLIKDFRDSITASDHSLVISISSTKLQRKITSQIVTKTVFPSAPQASLGKSIPLVFGSNAQVVPTVIEPTSGSSDTYNLFRAVYAVSASDGIEPQYLNGGIATVYAKGARESRALATFTDPTLYVLRQDPGATAGVVGNPLGGTEYAFPAFYNYNTDGYVITGGQIYLKGNNVAGAVSGQLRIGIYDMEKGSVPAERAITTAVIDKANYSAQYQANAEFSVIFTFESAVVLDNKRGYYITISGDNETGVSGTQIPYLNSGVNQRQFSRAQSATSGGTSWIKNNTTNRCYFSFLATAFLQDIYSTPILAQGYKYDVLKVFQNPYGFIAGYDSIDLTGLELVVEMNGLTDSNPATITPTNNLSLNHANHIAKFFDLYYTGSAWAFQGNFDLTAWNETHAIAWPSGNGYLSRTISGSTSGRETPESFLQRVMEQSGARIALRNNGKLGVWAWGTRVASSFVVPEEDIQITSFRVSDATHVINSIKAYYNKKITTITLLKNADSTTQFKDYASTIFWDYVTGGSLPALLAGASYNLFGSRELASITWDLLNDQVSAESLAYFYMTYYGFPIIDVDFVLQSDKYSSLEVLNVIEIQSPVLPSYFGTAPKALPFTFAGEALKFKKGFNLSRAKLYRLQVESKTVKFSKQGAPYLNCSGKILINPSDPT